MITKITGKYVIGFDGKNHVYIENGEVVYKDDTILFVGKKYSEPVDETISYPNAVISPGFIDLDALGDIDHVLIFAGVRPEYGKYLACDEAYFDHHREENMSAEDEAFKSLYAYSQLIMNGITTAMPITSVLYKKSAETYEEIVAAAHHAGKLGLRIYLGPSYICMKNVLAADGTMKVKMIEQEGKQGFQDAIRFAEKFHGTYNGLINAVLVPERIQMQTEEILIDSKAVARKLNCPIRLHAAQGISEYQFIQEKFGKSPIAYLDSIGFLDEKTSIPHVLYASGNSQIQDKSDADLDILRDTGTSVIHCPLVYARAGIYLESFGRYKRHGINLAMGTDTFPCDIIENMRIGSFVANHVDGAGKKTVYPRFFNAATLGGAKALGREDLGRLAVGAKADIIVIDLNGYSMGVCDDPVRTIGHCGSGRDVVTSIINGRVVMKDRVIPGLDLQHMQRKGQEYYEKMSVATL